MKNTRIDANVPLPGVGSASGFEGRADDPETFDSYSSSNVPPSTHHYHVETGESSLFKRSGVDSDSDDQSVDQVFFDSRTAPVDRCSSHIART